MTVDDEVLLILTDTKAEPRTGAVGLFVDIGTEAWFRDLVVTSR